jgi:hypothetical protein
LGADAAARTLAAAAAMEAYALRRSESACRLPEVNTPIYFAAKPPKRCTVSETHF